MYEPANLIKCFKASPASDISACFCMWMLLQRTKDGVERLPLVCKSGNDLAFLQCYMCPCINTFNYLACCHSVCGTAWLVLLLSLCVTIDSQIVGPVPFFHPTTAKHTCSPPQWTVWLTNLGYPCLTRKPDLSLIPKKLFGLASFHNLNDRLRIRETESVQGA